MARDTNTPRFDGRSIGEKAWEVRRDRGMSLRQVAAGANISPSYLSEVETGKRVLDRISVIVAIAGVLQVAPSELTALPIPAPANGHTDSVIEAVRLALDGIDIDRPGGTVMPSEALRDRVALIHRQVRMCEEEAVSGALPGLIRDLHASLLAGHDHDELLGLVVHLHVHVTRMWLAWAGAPADLRRRAVFLARRLARERENEHTLGVAAFGVADVLASGGALDLAAAELDSIDWPSVQTDTVGMTSALTVSRALLAVAGGSTSDAESAVDTAADMADRWGELGETDPLGFGFGPTNVGFRRIRLALEAGEPDRAARIAEQLEPDQNPFPASRAFYWVGYGRALAQLPRRYRGAVRAFQRAEKLHSRRIYRDPLALDVLADLTRRSGDDAIGREVRAMAHRAGLRV